MSETTPPLHEQIYAQLSQGLMAGVFAPGEQLTIRALAEELGTSMMPVREAVRRLSALKALEILPKRHVRVTSLTVRGFVEVAEMRKLLEGRATAIACEKMRKGELAQVKRVNRQLTTIAAKAAYRDVMKLNCEFHLTIYRCAQSELILETIEHLWLRVGPYLNYILSQELGKNLPLKRAFEHHTELIAALETRDSDQAVKAIHADIDEGMHSFLNSSSIRYSSELDRLTFAEGDMRLGDRPGGTTAGKSIRRLRT